MKVKKLYIIQHLGLGDHFVTKGLIVEKMSNYDKIIIFSRNYNVETVKNLYEEYGNKVDIRALNNNWNSGIRWNRIKELEAVAKVDNSDFLQIGHSPIEKHENASFDDSFYIQSGVDFNKKWDNFSIPERFYKKKPKRRNYAFVHQDKERGYEIDCSKIRIPIVEPDKSVYSNALEYIKIIQEASEIHCIDSSFINLIDLCMDSVPMCHNGNIYYHYYSRNAAIGAQPHLKHKWVRFDKVPEVEIISNHNDSLLYNVTEYFNIKKKKIIINFKINDGNVGNMFCSPLMYFDFGNEAMTMDVRRLKTNNFGGDIELNSNHVIVGGGGLIYQCHEQMNYISENVKGCLIGWGFGHNSHYNTFEMTKYPVYMNNYHLIGCRDYNKLYEHVPCVSCMHPGFDKEYEIKHEYVVYSHIDNIIDIGDEKYPCMVNYYPNMDKVLEFLGSGEVIITNVYHGIYWGILLKRKVICYAPFSTRFERFKYSFPVIQHFEHHKLKDVTNQLQTYTYSCNESRKLNIDFYTKVRELVL